MFRGSTIVVGGSQTRPTNTHTNNSVLKRRKPLTPRLVHSRMLAVADHLTRSVSLALQVAI